MHTSNNQPCETRAEKNASAFLEKWFKTSFKGSVSLNISAIAWSVSVLRSCVVSPPLSDGGQHLAQGLLEASVVRTRVWWWSEL